jgi:hypothetical protein
MIASHHHFVSKISFMKANPANKAKYNVKNPLELFKFNSVHGGAWRCAYKVDSIGEISALIHFLGIYA